MAWKAKASEQPARPAINPGIAAINMSLLREIDPQRSLNVGGITPFSATDYPGKLATVVFVQGCPWRCHYCHNPHLQLRATDAPLQWASVMDLLTRRAGLIDAIVFSGGEATTDPALWKAVRDARSLGFDVGLHTGGAYPNRLENILPSVDWVGLDIKAPFEDYQRITDVPRSGEQAAASAEAVLASGVNHEFRTTIHPSLLSEKKILDLAKALSRMGVKNYALQVFRAQGCCDKQLNAASLAGYPSADLVQRVSDLFPQFTLRQG